MRGSGVRVLFTHHKLQGLFRPHRKQIIPSRWSPLAVPEDGSRFLFRPPENGAGFGMGSAEIKRLFAQRHPCWFGIRKGLRISAGSFAGKGPVSPAPAAGALSAYLRLAYE
jgi:hypothetical protein